MKKLLELIRHFTPNWFAMTMGTGITAICLNTLSTFAPWIKELASFIWAWNIVLFLTFSLFFIVRLIIYPESWQRMMHHSTQPMFLGCIPMGLATILNGFVLFGTTYFGANAIQIAYELWWLDVALSLLSVFIVPYFMITAHDHRLDSMTALWLLPFVACEVASASGGLLMPHLTTLIALRVLVISLCLWAISVALALSILVIYFQRLCLHKIPAATLSASVWLPVGPTAMGALSLLLIGDASQNFRITTPPHIASLIQILPGLGLFCGIVLWALASWWFMIALLVTITYLKKKLSFNLGFWAYTFPLGVYTMASYFLGKQTDIHFFATLSMILVLCLFAVWIGITLYTLDGAIRGQLINDPTLPKAN